MLVASIFSITARSRTCGEAGAGVWASTLALVLLAHAATVQWRARSQRWEWALDGSRLGVADWHLGSGESFASGAWRSLSGHTAAPWSPMAWRQRVHPDDQPLLDQAIEAEAQAQAICMQTQDFTRAYDAFSAKQKPVFQGN